jgi:ABC-type lipoprotein release transport system permease subunit
MQITGAGFRETPGNENLIFDVKKVTDVLDNTEEIASYSTRLESFMLFSSEKKAIGGLLGLIDPEVESQISRLKKSLLEGDYLNENSSNSIYIGKDLSTRLGIGIGDELSLIGSATDNSFAADNVKVGGIFKTGLFEFDSSSAFINRSYFNDIVMGDNVASHIVIQPKDINQLTLLADKLQTTLGHEVEVLGWRDYFKEMVEAMELDSAFGYISIFILFVVIFFVIMIYALLSIFGRIREFGVMRALGTSQREIFGMLFFETFFIAIVAVLLGGLLGATSNYYYAINPIVVEGLEEMYKEYGVVDASIPSDFNLFTVAWNMGVILVLTLLSVLYPIFKVNSLTPTEAMHHV